MSDWNTEQAKHKAERRSPAPEVAPRSAPKRNKRKWKVEAPPIRGLGGSWWVIHHGESLENCLRWIDKQRRSYYVRRQDQSQRALDEALKRAEERANEYRIIDPDGNVVATPK